MLWPALFAQRVGHAVSLYRIPEPCLRVNPDGAATAGSTSLEGGAGLCRRRFPPVDYLRHRHSSSPHGLSMAAATASSPGSAQKNLPVSLLISIR